MGILILLHTHTAENITQELELHKSDPKGKEKPGIILLSVYILWMAYVNVKERSELFTPRYCGWYTPYWR